MPGLIKKLVVSAAAEGLVLQPTAQRNQRATLQIKYATHEMSLASSTVPSSSPSAEVHGIVGLLTLAPISFLIAITGREQVAQIRGFPIYVVTNIAIIPLSSQVEAKKAVALVSARPNIGAAGHSISAVDSDTSNDEESRADLTDEEDISDSPTGSVSLTKEGSPISRPEGPDRSTSNVAQDVIGKKGQYGRFAERWFSQQGWSAEKRRVQGMSTDKAERSRSASVVGKAPQEPPSVLEDKEKYEQGGSQSADDTGSMGNTLLPKLLRTTRMLLESRSFFYSIEVDITRRLGSQEETSSDLPLHKSVDPSFFWNHHLALPFIEGKHHSFVLPLMQGFVGQRAFILNKKIEDPTETIDTHENVSSVLEAQDSPEIRNKNSDFLLTLVSRRSIKRPGLRYLRRGVDQEGHTANTVETEQILSKASWASMERVYSFTQVRGSVPLFFSQSPYSFKPVPVMQHSPETNQRALTRHFANLMNRYGDVQVALLVDKKGGESEIGRKFEEGITDMNATNIITGRRVDFEWFDFHEACRGMKFENVSLLMKILGPKLDEFGETVELGGAIERRQCGILRTNCMDCLDRTNVVQSACGQRALEKQLEEEDIKVDLLTDGTTQWFNTLWADNGDQISREYSSTAALKGDYTRYRQRKLGGAINDFRLTLARYYNNIVNDYFSQAAIDYLQGNVTAQVFEDFEATLEDKDPAMSMAKVRANAIDTSSKIVIADQNEDLIGGWTLMCPREPNSVRTLPFDECVLLLTDVALYCVKFDWNVEKVISFDKVNLASITSIMKGTYITSTLAATQTDPEKNVGFVVKYKPGKENIARVNTRSLSSAVGSEGSEPGSRESFAKHGSEKETSMHKILAFKALPVRDNFTRVEGQGNHAISEKEVIDGVSAEIKRAAVGNGSRGSELLEDADIISLEQAKKSTGLLELWGHSLKKMVWA